MTEEAGGGYGHLPTEGSGQYGNLDKVNKPAFALNGAEEVFFLNLVDFIFL
jgi:hypothetical protein